MNNYRSLRLAIPSLPVLCSLFILMLSFAWTTPFGLQKGVVLSKGSNQAKLFLGNQTCTEWNLASDFRLYPNQVNPNPDSCGNPDIWHFLSADLNRQTYTPLPNFTTHAISVPGLEQWYGTYYTGPDDYHPAVGINATGADVYWWPANAVNAHPSPVELAVVGWRSPFTGVVSVNGLVSDLDNGGGDGIDWYIDRNSTNLASGSFDNGGTQDFRDGTGGYRLTNISVKTGDFLYFAIHPKNGYEYDSTRLEIQIQMVEVSLNDNFADARIIQEMPFGDFRDITNATVEADEPMPTCASAGGYQTLWYKYTPSVDGLLSVTTTYPNTDIFSAIWTGDQITKLEQVGCQASSPLQSTLKAGVTYLIQVGSLSSGASGEADIWMTYITPPANDERANATLITSLPFIENPDLSNATAAADDPSSCGSYWTQGKTIWYRISPAEDMAIESDLFDNWSDQFVFSVLQEENGGLHSLGCWQNLDSPIALRLNAGNTYYFMIDADPVATELVGFEVNARSLADNDDFADAVLLSLPSSTWQDITGASFEDNEPLPSCVDRIARSVWYKFTASRSDTVIAHRNSWGSSQFFAVYRGSSLSDLIPITCTTGNERFWFFTEPGNVYYLQLGSMNATLDSHWDGYYDYMDFSVNWAQPPTADFSYSPWDPTLFDNISFWDSSSDPDEIGFSAFEWDFGDGTTSNEPYPTHLFSQDGDYQVWHKATTMDGRVAEVRKLVQVRTHDVTITKFSVPKSASVGQTRTITVGLKNLRYAEMVEVRLYKSIPGDWVEVGVLTQYVPKRAGNRTTDFLFSYTFTPDDARVGKVVLRAVATIQNFRDALPADNEAISQSTKVNRSTPSPF